MTGRLRQQSGMTLVELLVAMTLMLIILGAALTSLDTGAQVAKVHANQTDAIESARATIDLIGKQLRNLASPVTQTNDPLNPPNSSVAVLPTIDKAAPDNVIFQTFEPNKRRVRYCYSTATESVYQMLQSTDPTASNLPGTPARTDGGDCSLTPGVTGWAKIKVVAKNVVNDRLTPAPPLFTFNASTSQVSKITEVGVELLVDVNSAAKRPDAARLSTAVDLRNQNQVPTAGFKVTGAGTKNTYLLDASASSDPEGRTLVYIWFDVPAPTTQTCTNGSAGCTSNEIGRGHTLVNQFPSSEAGTRYVKLEVVDPNGLPAFCPTQSPAEAACGSTKGNPVTVLP